MVRHEVTKEMMERLFKIFATGKGAPPTGKFGICVDAVHTFPPGVDLSLHIIDASDNLTVLTKLRLPRLSEQSTCLIEGFENSFNLTLESA